MMSYYYYNHMFSHIEKLLRGRASLVVSKHTGQKTPRMSCHLVVYEQKVGMH